MRHRPWSTVVVGVAVASVAVWALVVGTVVAFVLDPGIVGEPFLDMVFPLLLLVPFVLPAAGMELLLCVAVLVTALIGRREFDRGRPWLLVVSAWSLCVAAPTTVSLPGWCFPGALGWLGIALGCLALGVAAVATVLTVRAAQITPDRHGRAPNGRNGPRMDAFHPAGPGTPGDGYAMLPCNGAQGAPSRGAR